MSKKRLIAGTAALLASLGLMSMTLSAGPYTKPVDSAADYGDEELVQALETEVEHLNEQAPIMVDEETRLDRATLGPGATVTYHFTFPAYPAAQVDPSQLTSSLSPAVKENVCLNEALKNAMSKGASYVYAFHGNDGREISRMAVKSSDCS